MKYYLLFLLIISSKALSSPTLPLYMIVKNKDLCVFTRDKNSKPYENGFTLYMGTMDSKQGYKTSYEKSYKNIKVPTEENNCLTIDNSKFTQQIPYSINLDMNKTYSRRVCIKNENNRMKLVEAKSTFQCGTNEYDYSGRSLREKFLNWLGFN